jgi:hypothetical protein
MKRAMSHHLRVSQMQCMSKQQVGPSAKERRSSHYSRRAGRRTNANLPLVQVRQKVTRNKTAQPEKKQQKGFQAGEIHLHSRKDLLGRFSGAKTGATVLVFLLKNNQKRTPPVSGTG